jgi:hypothetical protein
VGGTDHKMVVSPDLYPEPVLRFGCLAADLLEMVNARHTKNLPWRKSDAQEFHWLLKLRAFRFLATPRDHAPQRGLNPAAMPKLSRRAIATVCVPVWALL